MDKLTVLIVDDHKMFREGLTELLNKEADIRVIGDAKDERETKTFLQKNKVDVVLMDIDLGEVSGIDLAAQIRKDFATTKILALSMHGDKNYIVKMLEAGATGYILKNAGKNEMVDAIHTVANGNTYFSSQVSEKLLDQIKNPTKNKKRSIKGTPLSDREIEVLKLICNEYSNPEIAEQLFISVRTVDTHRRNLLDKLGVKNTAGLVKYAFQHGIMDS